MTSSWAGYGWLWLAVLGVIVLVDWLIIRAVWRAANKPDSGDPTAAPSTMASPPPPRSGGHTWKSATVILLILAIPVGALLVVGLMKMQRRDRIVQGEVIAEVPITPPRAVRFGPAHEVILNDLDDAHGNEALSFAKSRLLSLPGDFGQRSAAARAGWLDSNRVDLLVDYARGQWALLSRGVQFRDLQTGAWDAPHLGFGGEWPDTAVLETRETRDATLYLLPTNAQPPLTFTFRTANADLGALQITGLFTNEPRGMKLRYKLAQRPLAGTNPNLILSRPIRWNAASKRWMLRRCSAQSRNACCIPWARNGRSQAKISTIAGKWSCLPGLRTVPRINFSTGWQQTESI
jgi:hypothetical protein